MRWAVVVVLGLAGCSVERDLDAERFDCAQGGLCTDAPDSGVPDGSAAPDGGPARDGGPTRDGGPPTCLPGWGLADACGGDLDGAWNLDEICGAGWFETELKLICPGAIVSHATFAGSGRLSFNADAGTYTAAQTWSVDADFDAAYCSREDCSETEAYVTVTLLGGRTTCTRTESGCDCNYQGTQSFTRDGEYEAVGSQFTLDPGTADELVFPYCVDEMQLTYAQEGTTFIADR